MHRKNNPIKITMFGKTSSAYQWMKSIVQIHAKQQDSEIHIQEVSETTKFLEHSIRRIPAFKVGDRWILPDEDDHGVYLGRVLAHIAKVDDKEIMKELLVPTDFSETADNALTYALDLAQEQKIGLRVLHVCQPVPSPGMEFPFSDAKIIEDRRQALITYVEKLRMKAKSSVEISSEFIIGLAADEITAMAKDKGQLIVMGATGEGGYLKKWIGSVSTAVISKASQPVLIIPHDYTFKSPKKVAYGGNNVELDIAIAPQLIKFCAACDASLELLHVDEKSDLYDGVLFKGSLETELGNPIKESVLKGADKYEVLNDYCLTNNIDILAMSREEGNVLSNLFRNSTTKSMSIKSQIPLLILHKP